MTVMRVSIMQPYIFPYIGYFQLIHAVDKFVIYDDVNFIKNGWINRNRILINGNATYFTVSLKEASPFKLISEIEFIDNRKKIIKSIELAYKKSPFYYDVFTMIYDIMSMPTEKISELAAKSVMSVCKYLNIGTKIEFSGELYSWSKGLDKADRIIEICKNNNAKVYINSLGGKDLYDKKYFKDNGVDLKFLRTNTLTYNQKMTGFVPSLSIIDVLMFNSIEEISTMLTLYELS